MIQKPTLKIFLIVLKKAQALLPALNYLSIRHLI